MMATLRGMNTFRWQFLAILLAGAIPAPQVLAQGFADEDRDWGVAAIPYLRGAPFTAPTPLSIPGANVIGTGGLKDILADASTNRHILIDVASGEGHLTLPGAIWIPGAGRGTSFVDPVQSGFADLLGKMTSGDRQRPLAFFCVSAQCWLSYNAALRAVAAGYTRVYWYRGGIDAWRAAGLPLVAIDPTPAR